MFRRHRQRYQLVPQYQNGVLKLSHNAGRQGIILVSEDRNMPRLTKAFIETELQFPKHGQVFYADVDLPGFGVRVTPHRKCFVAQWRSGDSDRSIVLGSCDEMAPEIARHEASRILTALTDGSLLANDGCESKPLRLSLSATCRFEVSERAQFMFIGT